MSFNIEDVYDIVLKWGTMYPIDNFKLIFINKFTYENRDGILKQKLLNYESIIRKLIKKCDWKHLIDVIEILKRFNINMETVYIPDINQGNGLYLKNILQYYFRHRWTCYYSSHNQHFDFSYLFDINELDYFVKFSIDVGISDDVIIRLIKNEICQYEDAMGDSWGYLFSRLFKQQIRCLKLVGHKYFIKFTYDRVMEQLFYTFRRLKRN